MEATFRGAARTYRERTASISERADPHESRARRLEQGAAPQTVNLEVRTVRAILRKNRLWAAVQPDVRILRAREDVGRLFPFRERSHFVFPGERYGASGDGATVAYDSVPTRPIGAGRKLGNQQRLVLASPVDSTI